MSKLAKKPIVIPENVKFIYENNFVKVTGPKGELQIEIKFPQYVEIVKNDNLVYVNRKNDTKEAKMYQGLYFALIKNMVKGVFEGYKKVLEIVGVGYQAQQQGNKLILKLGFSQPLVFEIPQGISVSIDQKGQEITLSGVDKYLVGETAAKIRSLKPPEPYKGTGIRYKGEHIIRKLGKAAIATGGGKK
ncbi:MAG: 50S ribosomal protein L6 [Endomicrobia bacterium]|nr:50S ribosomal protein L6 [Endomicrobiia bacterium]